jgi:hypothetical protein
MITGAAFPFFARRKRANVTPPRNLKDAPHPKNPRGRRLHFWRRRETTTFQKCLAVHMYYAAPQRIQK